MNIKNELIIGIIGSILVVFLTIFYFNQYQRQQAQYNVVQKLLPSTPASNTALTVEEVAKHNLADNCWIVIQGFVYDVTKYLNLHPGGKNRIIPYCGQDATSAFVSQGGKGTHSAQANLDLSKLKLGQLNETVDITNTSNQINNNVNSINSSGRRRENDDD